ncbi:chromosome undetermined scaffold_136, whole genome shotgun sequence [Clostridium botulinum B str. Osaka05]|uniref:Chromosome undetermined scaffold_136, whole genome shotgun sequence n=1 Tax=Clostridium botulinum B str. Osaka05 TaxID=1407017 RepID=A0A060N9K3_CLOBO|nr:hypothetical protein [Clostridium botulinum]BAO04924.1 chromosome undetermined scaffold_136, whole genome shotgun sequence [Clostridium botulinum B str. Osaka05]
MKNLLKAKGQIIGEFKGGSKLCNYRLLESKKEGLINHYITDILNNNLDEIVHIRLLDGRKEAFNSKGILEYKNDLGGSLWRVFVGDKCLDDVLWTYTDTIDEIQIVIDLIDEGEAAR